MKKGNLIARIGGILLIIAVVFAYLSIYFFPTVESINKYKRDTTDMKDRIANFGQAESNISFPDAKEEEFFKKAEQALRSRIPKIRGKGDLARLLTPVSGYLHELAGQEGVTGLVIEPGGEESGKKAAGFLKYRTLLMRFSGKFAKGLNFINHIPWNKYYIGIDNITISGGAIFPSYEVMIRVYYFAAGNAAPEVNGESGIVIDSDSEILLERVYHYMPEGYKKRELPASFGKLFSSR